MFEPMYVRCGYATKDDFLKNVVFREDIKLTKLLPYLAVAGILLAYIIANPSLISVASFVCALALFIAILLAVAVGTVMICKDRLILMTFTQSHVYPWESVESIREEAGRINVNTGKGLKFGALIDTKEVCLKIEVAAKKGLIPNSFVIG